MLPCRIPMKRILTILVAVALTLSVTACGKKTEEAPAPQPAPQPEVEVTIPTPAPSEPEQPAPEAKPSGIHEDGIGEVIALSDEEKARVLVQTTRTWLELYDEEKDELAVLVGRWLEADSGYIVADYDELIAMLDHQMETYFRNGLDVRVIETACDILGVPLPADVPARPSGIWEDGKGEDSMQGEGIGEVVALSAEEWFYMSSQTTNTWLELNEEEKDELVVMVGRWLEDINGFIVPDYDELVAMLDNQMEKYFRNGVDESVLDTVTDIYGLAL